MAEQASPFASLTLQDQKLIMGAFKSLKNGFEVSFPSHLPAAFVAFFAVNMTPPHVYDLKGADGRNSKSLATDLVFTASVSLFHHLCSLLFFAVEFQAYRQDNLHSPSVW